LGLESKTDNEEEDKEESGPDQVCEKFCFFYFS
jgi:hypothetical protein